MEPRFGIGRVTRFYVPLLLQAFSQSLSYPLVAGIVTHGAQGVNALTAFSQGLMIMFMIGAIGGGLITTGMVFAKTWYGYVAYRLLQQRCFGGEWCHSARWRERSKERWRSVNFPWRKGRFLYTVSGFCPHHGFDLPSPWF